MTTAVLDRETLHKAIDELPQARLPELVRFVGFLQDEDDEPLSDDEIAQIEFARAEIAAGDFYTLEEFNHRMAVLQ